MGLRFRMRICFIEDEKRYKGKALGWCQGLFFVFLEFLGVLVMGTVWFGVWYGLDLTGLGWKSLYF